MSDSFAIRAGPPIRGALRLAAPASLAEILSAPANFGTDGSVDATVIDRGKDGTLLLRTAFGTVSLKTNQPLALGTHVELRITAGKPPSVTITVTDSDAEDPPSIDEGAPVARRAATQPLPEEPATAKAAPTELSPARANGWPALDQVLATLDKAAPELATQLRAVLGVTSGPALAGTLLFILGTLYGDRWPGAAVARALSGATQGPLHTKLAADINDLVRLSGDAATGEWQVYTLPLLGGDTVRSLRLYLRRRDAEKKDPKGDGKRFIVEAELSGLGPLQLDGLVHGARLDLVLRSHVPLPEELRQEATAIFRSASAAQGLVGEFVFATVPNFTVAPLAPLIGHVAVSI